VYGLALLAIAGGWQCRLAPTWPEFAATYASVYRFTDGVAAFFGMLWAESERQRLCPAISSADSALESLRSVALRKAFGPPTGV
jgi:hypothetical protein